MKFSLLLLLVSFLQDVPFKPKEEYEIKIDYQFKQRPASDHSLVHVNGTARDHVNASTGILPYLELSVQILDAGGASKVKLTSNQSANLGSKRIKKDLVIPVVFGYTDDVKDRVTAHEYVLTFFSENRKQISRIVLFIDHDGTFIVNGETRGRF